LKKALVKKLRFGDLRSHDGYETDLGRAMPPVPKKRERGSLRREWLGRSLQRCSMGVRSQQWQFTVIAFLNWDSLGTGTGTAEDRGMIHSTGTGESMSRD
jgi:hypothetical protein